ncbi:MAG: hypothetical protein ABI311_08725 [Gemmatimonadaceae bacterium]
MSDFSPLRGARDEAASAALPHEIRRDGSARRGWMAPSLAPHSTMTELTQSPLPQPLSLLFLQSSITQCVNHLGETVPCP